MESRCIIIIDPQVDFTSVNGAYAQRHSEIKQIINTKGSIQQLMDSSPHHSYIVIYSDYIPCQFGEALSMCIPGTPGHAIDITIPLSIPRISKTQHSAFSNPSFIAHLHQHGYDHLYLCGFLAEYCVKQTALDGLQNNFHVSLIADCIATGDDVLERKTIMLQELEKEGAGITSSLYL
jgi:nicotinamidase/pyrazinamidase